MGTLEKTLKREVRRTKINRAIINTLYTTGVVTIGLLAPNVLGAMGKRGLINPPQKKQAVKKSFNKLVSQGYIEVKGGKAILTQKGEGFATLLGENLLSPRKPKRWDKKWRILIFDIPESKKKQREYIRMTLINLGFIRLQDSVWVYPYDCEDYINLLKTDLHAGKDVLYIIADKIEYDAPLRKYFELPLS